jgi:hypothetical protein
MNTNDRTKLNNTLRQIVLLATRAIQTDEPGGVLDLLDKVNDARENAIGHALVLRNAERESHADRTRRKAREADAAATLDALYNGDAAASARRARAKGVR